MKYSKLTRIYFMRFGNFCAPIQAQGVSKASHGRARVQKVRRGPQKVHRVALNPSNACARELHSRHCKRFKCASNWLQAFHKHLAYVLNVDALFSAGFCSLRGVATPAGKACRHWYNVGVYKGRRHLALAVRQHAFPAGVATPRRVQKQATNNAYTFKTYARCL